MKLFEKLFGSLALGVASVLFALFIMQAILINGFIGGGAEMFKVSLILGVIVSFTMLLVTHPKAFFGTAFVLGGGYLWFWRSGLLPNLVWHDLIYDVIAIILSFTALGHIFRRYGLKDPTGNYFVFIASLISWLMMSLFDVVRPHGLPLDVQRFVEPKQASLDWPRDRTVGVSLSGGGYRAALYHAGVLAALDDLGIKIDTLSTVSGGSIIGTYYALGGDPREFPHYVAENRFSLSREMLRFPNALLLATPMKVPTTNIELVPWLNYSRSSIQANLVERLFQVEVLPEEAPNLAINVTDVNYANRITFLNDKLLIDAPGYDNAELFNENEYLTPHSFSLFEKIAISGGFPIAFPPINFELQLIDYAGDSQVYKNMPLIDGGVIDNLGLDTLLALNELYRSQPSSERPERDLCSDSIIVSDAGAIFIPNREPSSLGAMARSFDVAGFHKDSLANKREYVNLQVRVTPKNILQRIDKASKNYKSYPVNEEGELSDDYIRDTAQRIALLPPIVLDWLIEDLPEEFQNRAREGLSGSVEFRRELTSADNPKRLMQRLSKLRRMPNSCNVHTDRNEEIARKECPLLDLEEAIDSSLKQYVRLFMTASTLRDFYDDEYALALYKLGRLLAFQSYTQIQNKASDEKPFCGPQ